MSKTRLNPEFRAKMTELVRGFVEHCEISRTLVGQIERFVRHDGRKYGLPTFTVYGPPEPGVETSFVNLLGANDSGDATAGEVVLQLIERLVLQPGIAAGRVLRILPVTNPVALELGVPVEEEPLLSSLEMAVEDFRNLASDGFIEIRLTDAPRLGLSVSGPVEIANAVRDTVEAVRRLQSEEFRDGVHLRSTRLRHEGRWHLTLEIPRGWSSSLAVHWASQVLVVFFRYHLQRLRLSYHEAARWMD
ncbi:MAG TPA: hypothetical protein PLA50_06685 [Bacteroidia bacterium]|nr:hypothetical protein [Bacteroidia bacterium]